MKPLDMNVTGLRTDAYQKQQTTTPKEDNLKEDHLKEERLREERLKELEAQATAKEEKAKMQDVLAVSKDGDTIQASKASVNASETTGELVKATEDGAVTKKAVEDMVPQTQMSDRTSETEKAQPKDDAVDSLVGLSKSEVERLYREGRISQNQYDLNMEQRKQETKPESKDTDKQDVNKAKDLKKLEQAQLDFITTMGTLTKEAMELENGGYEIETAMGDGTLASANVIINNK